ncbi:MAG: sterol desaturase family protein [archaeon]|nr:sterol desaturase family protein [archaeon]
MLSGFVRPKGSKAPLGILAGLPWSAYLTVLLVYGVYQMYTWGPAGLCLYMGLSTLNCWLDGLISNSPGENVRWLRHNGFGDGFVLGSMAANLVSSAVTGYALVQYILGAAPHLFAPMGLAGAFVESPVRLLEVAANMLLAEAAFTGAHALLHQTSLAPLHRMHHCCRASSFSTNLVFHPLDLALEFSGPVALVAAAHWLLWDDLPVLLLSFVLVQTWYALDHDEYLAFFHYYHHKHINSNYTIYLHHRSDPQRNALKDLIARPPDAA